MFTFKRKCGGKSRNLCCVSSRWQAVFHFKKFLSRRYFCLSYAYVRTHTEQTHCLFPFFFIFHIKCDVSACVRVVLCVPMCFAHVFCPVYFIIAPLCRLDGGVRAERRRNYRYMKWHPPLNIHKKESTIMKKKNTNMCVVYAHLKRKITCAHSFTANLLTQSHLYYHPSNLPWKIHKNVRRKKTVNHLFNCVCKINTIQVHNTSLTLSNHS